MMSNLIYNPQQRILPLDNNKMWIASFDIGKKNFAFYIEEINKSDILSLKVVDKNIRYNKCGTPTDTYKKFLENLYKNGKTILIKNSDLTCGNTSKKLTVEIFHNLTELLNSYSEYWDNCMAFVIEKQMSFGNKINITALKLGQHCYSYFCIKYGRSKSIFDFPAYHKTQILGAEKYIKPGGRVYKAVDKPKRKKWCINKALEILEIRSDKNTLNIFNGSKKMDDLADVICQLQAFKSVVLVDREEI